MKFTCLKESLLDALNITIRTIDTKPTLPILSNFLLQSQKGQINLQSTNLEESFSIWINAVVEEEGRITVPAQPFIELISSLQPQKLKMAVEENILSVMGENTQARFITMDPADFPQVPSFEQEEGVDFPKEKLFALIKKTAFAAASDEGRPVLTGVLFDLKDNLLTMVATDGFRLSEAMEEVRVDGHHNFKKAKIIIPARALHEVERSLREGEEEKITLKLSKERNQVAFRIGNTQFVVRLLQAEYPDYQKIIPTEFKLKAQVEKENFLQALKTAAIFAKRDGQTAKLFFDPTEGKLTLTAESAQYGSGKSVVPAIIEGTALEMAFNAKFLLDAFSSFPDEKITFSIKEAVAPVMLSVEEDKTYQHVVMPIRLEGK